MDQYIVMPVRHLVYDEDYSSRGYVSAGVPMVFDDLEQAREYLRWHADSCASRCYYSGQLQQCHVEGFESEVVEADHGHCSAGLYWDYLVLMPLVRSDDSRLCEYDLFQYLQELCSVGHSE